MSLIIGQNAWKQRVNKGVVTTYHWMDGKGAMFVTMANNHKGKAFVVPMACAFEYMDDEYLVQRAIACAQYLETDSTRYTVMAIADAIQRGLQDLVEMPPEPASIKPVDTSGDNIGEMTMKLNGGVIATKEITVPQGLN